MKNEKKFLDTMKADIMSADIPDAEKDKLMKNFLQLKNQKINLMITGDGVIIGLSQVADRNQGAAQT